jgi:hypothetical protein
MAEDDVGHGYAEQQSLGNHGAAGERLERIDGAQVTLAEEDAVVAKLLRAPGAPVNLVDVFDAAVNAMQAEFHLDLE